MNHHKVNIYPYILVRYDKTPKSIISATCRRYAKPKKEKRDLSRTITEKNQFV